MKLDKGLFCSLFLLFFLTACASSVVQTPEEKKADLYYSNGTDKLLEKNYTEALDNLQKAAALRPKDTKIQNNLGMAYYLKDQYALAKKHFQKAIDIDEKNSDARNNLASLYFKMGQFEQAEKEYIQVKNDLVYPHQCRTYYNLALISLKKNKVFEAVTLLKQSIKEREGYCPAHFELGKIYKSQLRLDDALKSFNAASQGFCVNYPAPMYEQALVLIELKQMSRARQKLMDVVARYHDSEIAELATNKLTEINNEIISNSSEAPKKISTTIENNTEKYKSPTF